MRSATIAILLITAPLFTSCSNEALQQREDRRTDRHLNVNERREIRTDARQERTDAWFDRHMH